MTFTDIDKNKHIFNFSEYRLQSYRKVTTFLALILVPFIINSFYQERILLGLLGSGTVLIFVINIISLFKANNFIISPAIATIAMMTVVISVVNELGVIGVLWGYPVLGMLFILHERKLALIFSLILIVFIISFSYFELGLEITLRVIATMGMTIIFMNLFLKVAEQQQDALSLMVITDSLTGAYNRRYFDERIKLSHGLRNRNIDVAMIMIDIDHFKNVNDVYGHKAGDKVLSLFVNLMSKRIRETDAFFRIGGEEFAVLLSNAKLETAKKLAEELRELIEATAFIENYTVTCSMGVASLNKDESTDSWMRRADNALYKAKENGRNRIELADV